jgi:hypothetical protein
MTNNDPKWEWDEYFLRKGKDFREFWNTYLNSEKRDILFILGLGFDPRMVLAVKTIIDAAGEGKRDCILLEFDEGKGSPSAKYNDDVNSNLFRLDRLFNKRGHIEKKSIQMFSKEKRRTGSRNVAKLFSGIDDFEGYTDIVIDISALPRVLYFPLIKRLLDLYDVSSQERNRKINIHVIVVENPVLDSKIQAEGMEDKADYISGFRGDIELQSTSDIPRIWMPLIGENREEYLEKIHTLVKPQEICPIMPFPATNPRRCDNLILDYQELLFDRLSIEPTDILYVAEQNPFEVYRKIVKTSIQYVKSLESIGGCKIIISALSSKVLSIGALLAVYDIAKNWKISGKDINIGIAHVEAQGYAMQKPSRINALDDKQELFSLWLKGECHEE